jgi:hypothetical protein
MIQREIAHAPTPPIRADLSDARQVRNHIHKVIAKVKAISLSGKASLGHLIFNG